MNCCLMTHARALSQQKWPLPRALDHGRSYRHCLPATHQGDPCLIPALRIMPMVENVLTDLLPVVVKTSSDVYIPRIGNIS
jgi:hypothetical protein